MKIYSLYLLCVIGGMVLLTMELVCGAESSLLGQQTLWEEKHDGRTVWSSELRGPRQLKPGPGDSPHKIKLEQTGRSEQAISFEREVVGPLLGTYDPYDPSGISLPGQPSFLEASLVDKDGTLGRILLLLTVWPTTMTNSTTQALVNVSKQKFFYLPGGQISAIGTISLPNNEDPQAHRSYFIPIVGGTGKYSGCSGTLNTTTTINPNVVTYVLSLIKPVK